MPDGDGDDEKEDKNKKLEDVLNDENVLIKTYLKAQKAISKINPDDTVGVGNTKIVIPNFMK